eukprot:1151962-Pelagomonas_calceolata.AAC.5
MPLLPHLPPTPPSLSLHLTCTCALAAAAVAAGSGSFVTNACTWEESKGDGSVAPYIPGQAPAHIKAGRYSWMEANHDGREHAIKACAN